MNNLNKINPFHITTVTIRPFRESNIISIFYLIYPTNPNQISFYKLWEIVVNSPDISLNTKKHLYTNANYTPAPRRSTPLSSIPLPITQPYDYSYESYTTYHNANSIRKISASKPLSTLSRLRARPPQRREATHRGIISWQSPFNPPGRYTSSRANHCRVSQLLSRAPAPPTTALDFRRHNTQSPAHIHIHAYRERGKERAAQKKTQTHVRIERVVCAYKSVSIAVSLILSLSLSRQLVV